MRRSTPRSHRRSCRSVTATVGICHAVMLIRYLTATRQARRGWAHHPAILIPCPTTVSCCRSHRFFSGGSHPAFQHPRSLKTALVDAVRRRTINKWIDRVAPTWFEEEQTRPAPSNSRSRDQHQLTTASKATTRDDTTGRANEASCAGCAASFRMEQGSARTQNGPWAEQRRGSQADARRPRIGSCSLRGTGGVPAACVQPSVQKYGIAVVREINHHFFQFLIWCQQTIIGCPRRPLGICRAPGLTGQHLISSAACSWLKMHLIHSTGQYQEPAQFCIVATLRDYHEPQRVELHHG